jgi:hypothetical protein
MKLTNDEVVAKTVKTYATLPNSFSGKGRTNITNTGLV